MGRFVGVNRGGGVDTGFKRRNRLRFALENERQRAAFALAHDDDDAALAVLIDRKAAIAAVFLVVGRLHVTAEIGAVDFDFPAGFQRIDFRSHRLADFVGHDVGRLVLAVEIARELQGAMALCAVDEDGDRQKVSRDRKLAAREDSAGRDAELMVTRFALENRTALVAVDAEATAVRADRLAFGRGPADLFEGVAGFLFGHASNPS